MVIKPGNSIKWNFRNSIKLNLKSLDRPLTHHDLLTYLSRSLSEEEKSKVISVGNFSSNRFWIIEFHPSLNTVNLFERPVLIKNRQFKFEDPNKFKIDDGRKSATLRFHFLPTNITDQTIARFINNLKLKDLEIKEISNEKFKEDGWTEVNNGIKRVRILYPIEINEQIQNLVGPTTESVLEDPANQTLEDVDQDWTDVLKPAYEIRKRGKAITYDLFKSFEDFDVILKEIKDGTINGNTWIFKVSRWR
ncbi:hypothetical protein BpHYR1_041068 [Brachionus plicatilis]|uniref:Uncharacterized protein n=1 Tax=Brachionus plicatilis TaxID=10195 RepID=A0A3M7QW38_BRAPC|nr:hypothetical protein BpHYR1_041068 [Brachionus plicatilis]